MAQDGKRATLLTPPFRASFVEVFAKRAFQEGQPGRYSVVALFEGFEVVNGVTSFKVPGAWPDKDKERWNAIIAACDKASRETFKMSFKDLSLNRAYKFPLHRGEEKTYAGYGPGTVFFTLASTKRKPGIVDRNGIPITQDGDEEFYAGCYARASCNPYAFNTIGKGIAIGLGNLQKIKDGERFDAFTSAQDDFGGDAAEYSDSSDSGGDSADAADDFGV
jgi:hypothetical protein